MNLLTVMAELYDSEINCAVSSFWDGGFTVKLGDTVNGFSASAEFWAPAGEQDSKWLARDGWREAAEWLHSAAIEHCQDSDYAKRYTETRMIAELEGRAG